MNFKVGFSFIGLLFLLMLFIPNIIWSKNLPSGYNLYVKKENKILLLFERIGEVLVSIFSLIFGGLNVGEISFSTVLLLLAFILMILYEICWIRYFKSSKKMIDMYNDIIGIPVALASLPVLSFLLLGIYADNYLIIFSTVLLGIGHIGIHLNYYKEITNENITKKVFKIILIVILILTFYFGGNMIYKLYRLNKLAYMSSNDMLLYDTKNDSNTKISITIIKDDIIDYKVYGKNMSLEENKYDYEIGSISKTYVGLLLSKAIEDGKVNIKDSISKYLDLDDGKYYPTIERLITHTSGYKPYYFDSKMITNKFIGDNDFYRIKKDSILKVVKNTKLEDCDYDFNYSNFGISVLGIVVEKVYQNDFSTIINNYIKDELRLDNTKVDIENKLTNSWNWEINDAYIPAGAIISNIEDMAKYLKLYLDSDEDYIINTYKPVKKVAVENYMYNKLDININEIGMTWMVDNKNNIVWHNGATTNYNSYIAFNKDKNIGVVILSNLNPNKKIPMTVIGNKMMKELCNE